MEDKRGTIQRIAESLYIAGAASLVAIDVMPYPVYLAICGVLFAAGAYKLYNFMAFIRYGGGGGGGLGLYYNKLKNAIEQLTPTQAAAAAAAGIILIPVTVYLAVMLLKKGVSTTIGWLQDMAIATGDAPADDDDADALLGAVGRQQALGNAPRQIGALPGEGEVERNLLREEEPTVSTAHIAGDIASIIYPVDLTDYYKKSTLENMHNFGWVVRLSNGEYKIRRGEPIWSVAMLQAYQDVIGDDNDVILKKYVMQLVAGGDPADVAFTIIQPLLDNLNIEQLQAVAERARSYVAAAALVVPPGFTWGESITDFIAEFRAAITLSEEALQEMRTVSALGNAPDITDINIRERLENLQDRFTQLRAPPGTLGETTGNIPTRLTVGAQPPTTERRLAVAETDRGGFSIRSGQ